VHSQIAVQLGGHAACVTCIRTTGFWSHTEEDLRWERFEAAIVCRLRAAIVCRLHALGLGGSVWGRGPARTELGT
jgi:hypothetical protein